MNGVAKHVTKSQQSQALFKHTEGFHFAWNRLLAHITPAKPVKQFNTFKHKYTFYLF